jgi:hypothetical protein
VVSSAAINVDYGQLMILAAKSVSDGSQQAK